MRQTHCLSWMPWLLCVTSMITISACGNKKSVEPDSPTISIESIQQDPESDVDNDGDGYFYQRGFIIKIARSAGDQELSVKTYYKPSGETAWGFFEEFTCLPINQLDWQIDFVQFYDLPHNIYDLKLEVYKCGAQSPAAIADPGTTRDLNDLKFEDSGEDLLGK
jgi:hypothetical protein